MLLYLIADGAAWGEYKKPVTAEEAAAGRNVWWGNGREKKKKKVGSTREEGGVDTDAAKQRAE